MDGYHRTMTEKPCTNCGKLVMTYQARKCEDCRKLKERESYERKRTTNKGKKRTRTALCKHCKSEFLSTKYWGNNWSLYCTRKCYKASYKKII